MAKKSSHAVDPPEPRKLRRHIRILVDIGRIAEQHSSIDRMLDQMVIQVARAVEVDHVKVLRYRQPSADLLMAAGFGWKEGLVRTATFSSDFRSPPGRTFQSGEPVCIPDTADAPGFVISHTLKDHEIVSLANVPILINGVAWGVLEVDSSSPRDFSRDTTEFMTAAAAMIGLAVQRQTTAHNESAAVAEAAAEARRREVLLHELQHRVKNYFQTILSSIRLQKRRFDNDEVKRALDHVANRINAVSLAHDQLSPQQDLRVVDVASYLRALCASIEQQIDGVAIETEADEIELSIERAVPLGLILNETITNSIKHAFDGEGGRILVRLQAGIGYNEARLTISDNGHGIRNPRSGGLGLQLIESLAQQIGGHVEQESTERGTSTAVTFPVIS